MLIFHGSEDNDVPISSIKTFAACSAELGNEVEFVELKGAPHMIGRIPYFARQMEAPRHDFLRELDWE